MKVKVDALEQQLAEKLLSTPQSAPVTWYGLLEMIARALIYEWATLWQVNGRVLQPSTTWRADSLCAVKLERDTYKRFLSSGEGNAGRVWQSGKPIWTTNITRNMCIPRSLDAEAAGLQSGTWFAVKTETNIYGVIELLGRRFHPESEEALLAIEKLGMALGKLLEKHMSEFQFS